MKFVAVLSILFASICMIQASELDLNLKVEYYYPEPSQGKVVLTLHGDTTTQDIDFGTQVFKRFENLNKKINFSEEIKKLTFHWHSKKAQPIILRKLEVNVNGSKIPEKYYFYKKIESGTDLSLIVKLMSIIKLSI